MFSYYSLEGKELAAEIYQYTLVGIFRCGQVYPHVGLSGEAISNTREFHTHLNGAFTLHHSEGLLNE